MSDQRDCCTALVTGANRGLGLELVRTLANRGWRVLATCRDLEAAPALRDLCARDEGIRVHLLDVSDFARIDALAGELSAESVDLLINNAGILGPGYREQDFGNTDYEAWMEALRVNTLAPMKMIEAFAEQVARSRKRVVVNVSSVTGSCSRPLFGGLYPYRTSKAALNCITAAAACDLKARGVAVVALHPGLLRTRLGTPEAPDSAASAAAKLVPLLESLGLEHSGRFLGPDGGDLPW